jgi:chromosome segregation protein
MHIKKLEICGFKSFVDKTVIHFDHDVIGIVGPNGCGKSNIVDAIRWCMGEQSAKHLRGRAMEDVIFNGSESRAQHGMAEVTLSFDNGDKEYAQTLPEQYRDYPEIAVTRRLFRDGTSEYLINKTQVRLRDVTDLFLGTGVGTKAYSIVEQGRIGQIVSSRPQDRRLYIEEAAGITKYKLRRKQAERKMDLTRQNLLRVTDIVAEIERNRNSLKRQAAKAERYIRYREELEDLFLHDAAHRLLEMIVTEKVSIVDTDELRKQSAELNAALAAGEARLAAARAESTSIEARYEEATTEARSAEQQLTQLQSEVQRAQDRSSHLEQRLDQLEAERAELSARQQQLAKERESLDERVTWLDQDESSRQEQADAENEEFETLRQAEQEAEAAVADSRKRSAELQAETASTQARLEALNQRLEEVNARKEESQAEHVQLSQDVQTYTAQCDELSRQLETLAESHSAATLETSKVEAELATAREEHRGHTQALSDLKDELSHKSNRLSVLEDLHRRLEGVGAGTKVLLEKSDPAVVGLLADRVDVSERYTEAFASLLGDRLHCVIVSDPERGIALLDELKESKGGRATIAPQNRAPVPESRSEVEDDPLVLARLIDEVEHDPEDAALVRGLVGDAVVVESATDALSINARFVGVTAVTLDGTVVREDGLVSGGSADDMASAMLEQKREMRQLQSEIEGLGARTEEHAELCQGAEQRLADLERSLETSRQTQHERELARLKVERDLSNKNNELSQANKRHERLSTECQQVATKVGELEAELRAHTEKLDGAQREAAEAAQQFAELEAKALEQKERASTKAARVTERKVRLAQVREQLEAARTSLSRIDAEATSTAERLTKLTEEWRQTAMDAGRAAAQWMLGTGSCSEAEVRAHNAQTELEDVRGLLEQVRASLGEHEAELRQARVELSEVDERVRAGEMKLQKLELEREHLVSNVAERYRGLHLPAVVGDYHSRPAPDAEHRRRIDELSKLIDRMGPVNLDAKQEFEDAEKRFDELSSQRNDIQEALEELERAIRHMDRESRRRFKETFEMVNGLFKKTFAKLFKGGRGELVMTDPDNVLETGVDIIAQPPGKRLGNIELMSGGEKALTATALIFAIFQHRPSPFCVLDEVDAPLDDANVGRYNEAVRSMTSSSQFVLITHIKKTMQTVDVLYGVTMGEPGVSRVVSVKVNEAASRSEKNPGALETPAQGGSDTTQVA